MNKELAVSQRMLRVQNCTALLLHIHNAQSGVQKLLILPKQSLPL